MAKFSPAMLVPAQQAPEFNKGAGARSIKDVVLANISKMKEQFAAGDAAEGKVNFKIAGEKVAFAIRVSNTALVLGQFEDNGVTADVREMTVPKANFVEALDYYADRVKVGEFDAQIAGLSERTEARTEKLRNTRAAKKAEKEAKPA